MKYILQYILCYYYVLYVRIINSFTPFIKNKACYIIKSLSGSFSGLLENIPYVNNHFLNTHTIIERDNLQCIMNQEETDGYALDFCEKDKIIVIGYIDHDPKKEAFKRFSKLS